MKKWALEQLYDQAKTRERKKKHNALLFFSVLFLFPGVNNTRSRSVYIYIYIYMRSNDRMLPRLCEESQLFLLKNNNNKIVDCVSHFSF